MSAESEVKQRIKKHGKITIAEFIEVALYWPQGGYYSSGEAVGSHGDYYTSPVAHPAFGALLTVQLFQMWHEMGKPAPFTVLELGAGNGLLCKDIITYANEMPEEFARAIRYICLDRRMPEVLEADLPNTSRILSDRLPFKQVIGCILSNEYLDAFPVHQIMMTKDGLKEIYVTLEQDNLVEVVDDLSELRIEKHFIDLGVSLVEGQTAEVNLSLETWAKDVSSALERGFVLTIDYGHTAHDLYDPDIRRKGTLVTYHKHVQTDAPLAMIGRQDITAQVDFTSVRKFGENAGLNTLGLITQRELLSNLSLTTLRQSLANKRLSPQQMQTNQTGILDLARAGGLGEFKILFQGKNVCTSKLWGIELSEEVAPLVGSLPVPLLTRQHLKSIDRMSLGRDAGFEFLWSFSESESIQ